MKLASHHRIAAAFAALVICVSPSCSTPPKVTYQDPALAGDPSDYKLKDIFMALPSSYFEISFNERAKWLNSKHTTIDDSKKEIMMLGDGAQAGIRMTVLTWTRPNYTVSVIRYTERETITTQLKRVPGGWAETSSTSVPR